VQNHVDQCEPVDDVMQRLTDKYGPVAEASKYLFSSKGHWLAVPCSAGNQNKGPCGRISVLRDVAGIDVLKMYPPSADPTPEAEKWTLDAMLRAAEACKKAKMTFGIGLGTTPDSVDTAGALFAAFGAEVITAGGEVNTRSDAVRQVLEYAQHLVKYLPDDAVSYDDASSNPRPGLSPAVTRRRWRRIVGPFRRPRGRKGGSCRWARSRGGSGTSVRTRPPQRN
jgi:hypothetical protein